MLDSTLSQFKLMIGEYDIEGFVGHANPFFCYGLFVLTVLISQITFLNMLIAIMADTFEKVIEQKPRFSLKSRIAILTSMECIISSEKFDSESKIFMYVIQPERCEEEIDTQSDAWRGQLHFN